MVNYKSILKEVNSVSSGVELVAVSKTKPIDLILTAYKDGARIFGENRVQEISEKLRDRPSDMKVYLIGHLQTNKVKKAVSLVDRVESVDSIHLLEAIEKECSKIGKKMEILLEINSSGDDNKSGFESREELFKAVDAIQDMPHLIFKGLMTVGPLGFDKEKNAKSFSYTKALFDEIKKIYPIDVLSMGMSADWKQAIEYGSTEVRIGSAIFGDRV